MAAIEGKKLLLEVDGIVCSGCAMDMEKLMLALEGVLDVEVSYARGDIRISIDPAEITKAEILAKVRSFGLQARLVST